MKHKAFFSLSVSLFVLTILCSFSLSAQDVSLPWDTTLRPSIQGITYGPISKTLLAEADSITLLNAAGEIVNDVRVMSFDLVATYSGDIYQKSNKGNRFSDEVKTFLRVAPKGTKIYFDKMIIGKTDDQTFRANLLQLVVD